MCDRKKLNQKTPPLRLAVWGVAAWGILAVAHIACQSHAGPREKSRDVVDETLDLLEGYYFATLSCYMETVGWSRSRGISKSESLPSLPRPWSRYLPWIEGDAQKPAYRHWLTWKCGRFAGICKIDELAGGAYRALGSYYDGRSVLQLNFDNETAHVVPRGFRTIGVTIWPHYLLGIEGVEPLSTHLALARAESRLRSSEGEANVTKLTFPRGHGEIITLAVAPHETAVKIHSLSFANRDGQLLYEMILKEWGSELALPGRASVKYPIQHPSLSRGSAEGAFIEQHLRLEWSKEDGITGRYHQEIAGRCPVFSYGTEMFMSPTGYDRIIQSEVSRIESEISKQKSNKILEVGKELLDELNDEDIERHWRGGLSTEDGSWPNNDRSLVADRAGFRSFGDDYCAQVALSALAHMEGLDVGFEQIYNAASDPTLSLAELIELSSEIGTPLVPMRVDRKLIFRVRAPFLMYEKGVGSVGHVGLAVPLSQKQVLFWRSPGKTVTLEEGKWLGGADGDIVLVRKGEEGELARITDSSDSSILSRMVVFGILAGGVAVLLAMIRRNRGRELAAGSCICVGVLFWSCGRPQEPILVANPELIEVTLDHFGEHLWLKTEIESRAQQAIMANIGPANCGCVSVVTRKVLLIPGEATEVELRVDAREPGKQEYKVPVRDLEGKLLGHFKVELDVRARIHTTPKHIVVRLNDDYPAEKKAFVVQAYRPKGVEPMLELNSSEPRFVPYVVEHNVVSGSRFERDDYTVGIKYVEAREGTVKRAIVPTTIGVKQIVPGAAGPNRISIPISIIVASE